MALAMATRMCASEKLLPEASRELRLRMVFEHSKWDMQCEDHCILADYPLLLAREELAVLARDAEALARETLAAERELLARPELQARLGLPSEIVRLLRGLRVAAPGIARVLRFDFHLTDEGWRISEVNCDVPSGFIEAGALSSSMQPYVSSASASPDAAKAYVSALRRATGDGATLALVHCTAYSDDRQVMQHLAREATLAGMTALPAAPMHLHWCDGMTRCFGLPVDAIIRFFPAEWLPNLRDGGSWRNFFCDSRTPTSNPAYALLTQSKRLPAIWDELGSPLPTWRRLLPETRCPSRVRDLGAADWVVKPALGRVGADIALAGVTTALERVKILAAARRRPSDWVAQRRFNVLPMETPDGLRFATIGLFVIDGGFAGAYARISVSPLIDENAQDVAVLIKENDD